MFVTCGSSHKSKALSRQHTTFLCSSSQVQRFLEENDETSKLRQRQALVDLQGFSLAQESSLQGVFGVRQAAAAANCTSCSGCFAAVLFSRSCWTIYE
jgi:hypothetical protein